MFIFRMKMYEFHNYYHLYYSKYSDIAYKQEAENMNIKCTKI